MNHGFEKIQDRIRFPPCLDFLINRGVFSGEPYSVLIKNRTL